MSAKIPFKISEEKLVLCEGEADKAIFRRLLELNGCTGIQVVDYGGKDEIPRALEYLVTQKPDHPIRSLLITRDADENWANALENVKKSLDTVKGQVELSVPVDLDCFTTSPLAVAISLLPGVQMNGELEDLCVQSYATDPIIPCIDGYFECTDMVGVGVEEKDRSKAKMQVWSAVRGKPGEALYYSFKDGKFDAFLKHTSFQPLVDLLRQMSELA